MRGAICDRKDPEQCTRPATRVPVIQAPPLGHPEYKGPALEARIGLQVCEEHATDANALSLLDAAFPLLRDVARAAGRADPDPERTSIVWQRIQ